MFKNVRFYRIHSDWPEGEEVLSGMLESVGFKPCPAYSGLSVGFEAPVENAGDRLVRSLGGADLLQMRRQTKVLPVAAVKEALADRIDEFTRRTTQRPTRREKRELKEEVYADLLPRALLKSDRIRAFYIRSESILAIATPNAKIAEELLDRLRDAFGSLQATPLEFKKSAQTLMKEIFLGGDVAQFTAGRECRMKDPSEPTSTVNWFDMELHDASVRTHVRDGLILDRLGISFNAIVRFVLADDLVLRKIRFEGLEELDELDDEDPLVRHDAEFVLTSGLLRAVVVALKAQLGGYVRA